MEKFIQKSGITIRPAIDTDFVTIKSIAQASFLEPKNWSLVLSNLKQYQYEYLKDTEFGQMNIDVALNSNNIICAYIYYQYRANGDMYLFELAANPKDTANKVYYAGTILLGYSIKKALQKTPKIIRATLNIVPNYKNTNSLIHYYQKFDYKICEEEGYTASGKPRPQNNIWLIANDLENTLAKIKTYLDLRLV